MTKNDGAWKQIFDQLNVMDEVEQKGFFDISANQIKEFGNREPRLMTKFDYEQSIPPTLKNNQLSILAIRNGLYRIAQTNPYLKIDEELPEKIISVDFPDDIISLDPFEITTESNALDIAYLSGIMDEVFEEKTRLTIRGSFSRGVDFNFSLQDIKNNSIQYDVQGVGIEIDSGYEGNSSLNLIEAKIGGRNNLNIRQLLYPELYWRVNIQGKKELRNYILFYQQPIFRFIPFIYDKDSFYVDQSKERAFKIKTGELFDFHQIEYKEPELVNYDAPFPQADRFDKVVIIMSKISEYGSVAKSDLQEDLSSDLGLSERQTDYYFNVLKWMKVADYQDGEISLTLLGKEIEELEYYDKMKRLAEIVFSEKIFNIALKSGIEAIPDNLFTEKWRVGSEDSATIPRRKQTVKMWIEFFEEVFE